MALINRKKKPMARPKKTRVYGDIVLADYLYADNKGREGHWRYKRPDNTFKHFSAATAVEANRIAEANNTRRDQMPSLKSKARGNLAAYIPQFIAYREEQSPDLTEKASWQNRTYAMLQLGREIALPLPMIDRDTIQSWWDRQTHHQQKARHAEFRKLFNYLMGRELLKSLQYNPFTTADDKPRLYLRSQPKRQSERLTRDGFWAIYNAAGKLGYPCLQIAMGISLTTFMREGDICSLKLDEHLEGTLLKKVIGKSKNQKGDAKAARLSWDVGNYELLKQLIQRARELSLVNRRCPYVISHWPKQRRLGKGKTHLAQVTPRRLITMFDEARKLAGFTGENPPVFHGVRSLATKLATDSGYNIKSIQHANAHSSESMTNLYKEGHDLPFENVSILFSSSDIGGIFS